MPCVHILVSKNRVPSTRKTAQPWYTYMKEALFLMYTKSQADVGHLRRL